MTSPTPTNRPYSSPWFDALLAKFARGEFLSQNEVGELLTEHTALMEHVWLARVVPPPAGSPKETT